MVWNLDWGENFEKIVKAAGPEASVLPCVLTRVDVFRHLQFEWDAFWSLSSDRPVGMESGAIPWSSVDRLAERHGIVGDDFDRLLSLISQLDGAYRDYHKGKT